MNKRVGIVVVTYNRLKLLNEVIDALRKQTYGNNQIIVVNNGSTDGTPQWLADQQDILTITQENLGGAGGFYTGMKYVAEHDFDFAWVMDDDVICYPNALEELLKSLDVKEGIGFVCSRVVGTDGRPMNTPTISSATKGNVYSDLIELVDKHAMVGVKESTFVSVLVPVKIIQKEGLPIKEYFIWGDDSEFTERLSMRYPCYVVCRSVVVHKRSIQTALIFTEEKDPKRLRNYFFMFRNQAYTKLKGKKKKKIMKHFAQTFLCAMSLFFTLRWKHLGIIIKAYSALLTFHPEIQYPHTKRLNTVNRGRGK